LNSSCVRLVLALSLDGRLASPEGGAASLGGIGDRRALEEALAWADAAFIGSKTLLEHRSTCLIKSKKLLQVRRFEGRSEQPLILVVSSKKDHPLDMPFFEQPLRRWLVGPAQTMDDFTGDLSIPEGFERYLPMAGDWRTTVLKLVDEGMTRFLVLGGARLATSFLKDDCIDELQLTFTPRILGGKYLWFDDEIDPLPNNLQNSHVWSLDHIENLGGNEVKLFYVRGNR